MCIQDRFCEYLAYLRQEGRAGKTIQTHRRFLEKVIGPAVGDTKLCDLRLVDTAKIKQRARNHGRTGERRALSVFRGYLRYLFRAGENLPFSWRDVEVPKYVSKEGGEYLTPAELKMVLEAFPVHTMPGLRTRALFETLLATGMRPQEALALNGEGVDWEDRSMKIVNCKTKERERVYLTRRSAAWLKRYLRARDDTDPALFVSSHGNRLSQRTSMDYITSVTADLPIDKHICHRILRRTFATYLVQGGADIKSTQTLMRHASPSTTLNHYIGLERERARGEHHRVMNRIASDDEARTVEAAPSRISSTAPIAYNLVAPRDNKKRQL